VVGKAAGDVFEHPAQGEVQRLSHWVIPPAGDIKFDTAKPKFEIGQIAVLKPLFE
jgi:hypothetical protein